MTRLEASKKHFNFNIPTPLVTYCFSSTSTPSSMLASCPPSPPLCLSSSLILEILKNWKEKWAIICITNTCFLKFGMKMVSPQKILSFYSTQPTNNSHTVTNNLTSDYFQNIGKRCKIEGNTCNMNAPNQPSPFWNV